ncbi:MAG: L-2-hydroxyglutarate oxidase [Gemmataceae bacterium]
MAPSVFIAPETRTYDIAVVGAGIVGLATARALLERYPVSLVMLEAEKEVAQHQTGHNSGVIHSGLYYKPGSEKARNCAVGREAMYRFCKDHGVAHEACGKVVVATDESEIPALKELERRGLANGLKGVRWLNGEEIHEHEPHVRGVAGLLVRETGIADYKGVCRVLASMIEERGGWIRTEARFQQAKASGSELVLETSAGEMKARHLINCAGLQSDRVARACGVEPGLQIIPFRGEYYEVVGPRRSCVKNLIYPVPDPRFPFLGVHFTRTVEGMIEAGPNAVLALKREGYTWGDFSAGDVLQMARFRGFWKMALRYWRTGIGEVLRSLRKKAFLHALQKLIPELQMDDIHPAGSGVRAQAVEPTGALVDDFRILGQERMVHVLNAPSPAATASLSIGQTITELAARHFTLPTRTGAHSA